MQSIAIALSLVIVTTFTSGFAHAADGTAAGQSLCARLQEAAHRSEIRVESLHTALPEQRLRDALLRRALVLADMLTEGQARRASYTELANTYDPIFSTIIVAGTPYQAVNVALGENPYVYLFNYDTMTFSGISSLDGSIQVGHEWCDVEFETTAL